MNEFFVIVAGEEKAPLLPILELFQQHVGECAGKLQIRPAEPRLQQFQQGIQHEGIIIQIGIQMRLAILAGRQQAAIFPHRGVD